MTTSVRGGRADHLADHGWAIRFITSALVPVVHMIGSTPPMIAATVISLGLARWTAPSMMASRKS